MHFETPFKYAAEVHQELRGDLGKILENGVFIQESEIEEKLGALCGWLRSTPETTTLRVNDESLGLESAREIVESITERGRKELPRVSRQSNIPELIAIHCWDQSVFLDLEKYSKEVIVDASCGSAVLRGAHVFAPGIVGIPRGLVVGDTVSVYSDVTGRCKRGLAKKYDDDRKVFLGNGLLKQTRKNLFGAGTKNASGIAVRMTDVVSRIPRINIDASLGGKILLQNLPSIICTRILNPRPGETVLDMCAAPGNKTTHASFLMENKGRIVALEKNQSKIEKLSRRCQEFGASNVEVFRFDSTKAVTEKNSEGALTEKAPPFPEETFDRILLDGPCSALGLRPQLVNSIRASQLRSYVSLQRKLLDAGVRLLKENGILVYSTCTVTIAENEGIVAWALARFPRLRLIPAGEELNICKYASAAYNVDGLTREQSDALCRFGPGSDSVGFFVARFTKVYPTPTDYTLTNKT